MFDISELACAALMILMPPRKRARSAASRGESFGKILLALAGRNRRTSSMSRQCAREIDETATAPPITAMASLRLVSYASRVLVVQARVGSSM
ncbi:MAG: hypothetical protein DI625_17445 [Sphingomonas sp.]|nr:MAG: hypothetical protein DI625_17445 [Sphingomonas sp.]